MAPRFCFCCSQCCRLWYGYGGHTVTRVPSLVALAVRALLMMLVQSQSPLSVVVVASTSTSTSLSSLRLWLS